MWLSNSCGLLLHHCRPRHFGNVGEWVGGVGTAAAIRLGFLEYRDRWKRDWAKDVVPQVLKVGDIGEGGGMEATVKSLRKKVFSLWRVWQGFVSDKTNSDFARLISSIELLRSTHEGAWPRTGVFDSNSPYHHTNLVADIRKVWGTIYHGALNGQVDLGKPLTEWEVRHLQIGRIGSRKT